MTADRHPARRAVALLAAVVLMLVAALTFGSSPAVADGGSLPGTGVAAFDFAKPDDVGPIADVSAGEGRETAADSYDNAVGYCVATQTTGAGGVTRVDLYATGNASGPKVGPSDFDVGGPEDEVCPGEDPGTGLLYGASTFASEADPQTRGKIWMLPAGSAVPPDFEVIPDGAMGSYGNNLAFLNYIGVVCGYGVG